MRTSGVRTSCGSVTHRTQACAYVASRPSDTRSPRCCCWSAPGALSCRAPKHLVIRHGASRGGSAPQQRRELGSRHRLATRGCHGRARPTRLAHAVRKPDWRDRKSTGGTQGLKGIDIARLKRRRTDRQRPHAPSCRPRIGAGPLPRVCAPVPPVAYTPLPSARLPKRPRHDRTRTPLAARRPPARAGWAAASTAALPSTLSRPALPTVLDPDMGR
jgi:hypothetical protein